MRDDSAFLEQLSEHPEDVATLLVYADWLDDNEDDRAAFLRLQQDTLGLRHRMKGFSDTSNRLLRLGKKLDPKWLALVSRPRLAGTCWDGTSTLHDSPTIWRFLPGGVLNYTSRSGTFQNGTWWQIGNHVAMETNRHYADYEGFVGGDLLRGKASNVADQKWRWQARRTTDPETCDPGDPVKEVFGGHANDPPRRGRRRR